MDDMTNDTASEGRFTPAMKWALGGFVAAAAISLMIPATILESFVSAIGLPEMIEASAPPLGVNARLIIALFCGIVAAAIVFAFAPNKAGLSFSKREAQEDDPDYEYGGTEQDAKPTFMDRLRGLTSGDIESGIRDLSDLPKIRSADAHPDAPARRPLFAGEDLADPTPLAVQQFAEDEMAAAPMPAPSEAHQDYEPAFQAGPDYEAEPDYDAGLDMEYEEYVPQAGSEAEKEAEAELEDGTVQEAEVGPVPEPEELAPVASEAAPKAQPSLSNDDLNNLPINDLVDRLEQSLAALKNGTPAPPQAETVQPMPDPVPAAERPPEQEPVRYVPPGSSERTMAAKPETATAQKADDMDEALKAALATLQRMTSK